MQVPNFMERQPVSSYDFDLDYNAQPNYIPRSRRNPFMEDYLMTTLKYWLDPARSCSIIYLTVEGG